ncbi:hypothetical protein D3C76_52230 [compost metagenome]
MIALMIEISFFTKRSVIQYGEHHVLNTFLEQPDYIKREQINYIELAKKEETKNRRILTLIDKLKD